MATSLLLCQRVVRSTSLGLSNVQRNLCVSQTTKSFRYFSVSVSRDLRTSELTENNYSSLRADSARLWSDIHDTAAHFGPGRRYGDKPEQTGLSRLTLSDEDKAARAWFAEKVRDLGCDVKIDAIGNMFAVRPGLRNDVAPTYVGSHLDSQPLGGRFDGALGVLCGLEMLRVLNDNWIETEAPVGVVNWTNEEGARFPISMMGSAVWAGARELNDIYKLEEVSAGPDGKRKTVEEELKRIGYVGKDNSIKMAGHFELHIEQGPKLVTSGQPVGIVRGVQAYKWFEVNVYGKACHTGATGYEHRADPLHTASEIISSLRGIAMAKGGLASVGIINAKPGSTNTVPDQVAFTLDIRHEFDKELEDLIEAIIKHAKDVVQAQNDQAKKSHAPEISLSIKETFHSAATAFDKVAIESAAKSAADVTGRSGDDAAPYMVSGAGHDSVNTAKHCPTAMVFIPCKDGVSHHPEEWSTQDDCATGTNVIIQSVLRFDKWRHQQGL